MLIDEKSRIYVFFEKAPFFLQISFTLQHLNDARLWFIQQILNDVLMWYCMGDIAFWLNKIKDMCSLVRTNGGMTNVLQQAYVHIF